MISKIIHSRPASVILIASSALWVAFFSEFLVHFLDLPISDISAHLLTSCVIALLLAVVSWMVIGKLERLNLQLKLKATEAEAAKQEKRAGEQRARAEKEIEVERRKIHQATLLASYHYLNNALNQFQLVFLHLEETGTVDQALIEEIKASMEKTAKEMREFGEIANPTYETVDQFIRDRL